MTYVLLGARSAIGELDNTSNNVGNWTVTFDPATLNANINPQFEVYKITMQTQSQQSIIPFTVFVGSQFWDNSFIPGGGVLPGNSWDPVQTLKLRPGQYLYFYFAEPASDGTPPTITLWLQYDADLANKYGFN